MIMINMSVTLSLLFSLLLSTASGHDITQILNQYPDYSTFNSYLTQTNLATSINNRQTVTILVVSNSALSSLSSTSSLDTIKNILSVHVILDYYDVPKLQQLTSSSTLLTTLFQSTGFALGQQGFIKVTHPSATTTALESAMPGSPQASSIVGSAVMAEPYNISVIQISSLIIPQGIDGTKTSSPPSTTPTTTTTTATTPPPPPPPPPATVTAAPPTSTIKAPVPSAATPKPTSTSSPPTKAAAAPSKASAAPTKAVVAPTKASSAPTTAATPSTTPASAPTSGASADAPAGAEATEEPTETTPETTPDAGNGTKGKSAAATLEIGVAIVCTMALSILYTTSTI